MHIYDAHTVECVRVVGGRLVAWSWALIGVLIGRKALWTLAEVAYRKVPFCVSMPTPRPR